MKGELWLYLHMQAWASSLPSDISGQCEKPRKEGWQPIEDSYACFLFPAFWSEPIIILQMKRLLSILGLMLMLLSAKAQGTDVVITLTEAGQLGEKIDLLETTTINNLTIKGQVGAEDLITLNDAVGKLSTVQTLDISEITLVPDETKCYAELYRGADGLSNTYIYHRFYISDNPRTEIVTGDTSLGVGVKVYEFYNNNLAEAFSGTQAYKKIILPKLESLGQYIVGGNKVVEEVVIQEGAKYVGEGAFCNTAALKRIELPASVDSVGKRAFAETVGEIIFKTPLRSIGMYAFEKSNITTFDFSALEEMGDCAFSRSSLSGTINLQKLTDIPEEAFYQCAITKVVLSQEISKIGTKAFAYSQLADINIPATSVNIGREAFYATPWYENNSTPDVYGIVYVGSTAYYCQGTKTDIVIKDGTTSLADGLFPINKTLTSVKLPESLKYIGRQTFYYQDQLTNIELPASVEEIGEAALSGCNSLNFDSYPANLRVIGDNAFRGCTALSCGNFPANLEVIGDEAFEECTSLLELTLPENLKEAKWDPFRKCSNISIIYLNSKNAKTYFHLDGLTHIVVGPEVTYIGSFSRSPKLRVVRFENREPSTPLVIGEAAFSGCENLTTCHLPEATVSIETNAFYKCKNVDLGEFPSGIRYVGAYAFEGVETPTEIVDIQMDSIPAYAFYEFSGLSRITFANPIKHLGYGCLAGTSISSFALPAALMNADEISYPFNGGGFYYPVYCTNLKTVTFEEGTKKFNISLLGTNVEELEVPDGVESFLTRVPASLKTLSLPGECRELDQYNFASNRNVAVSWRIPEDYKYDEQEPLFTIPTGWCQNMAVPEHSMVIPEGFGTCGASAFANVQMNKLTFPSTLETIYSNALYDSRIRTVEFTGEEPPITETRGKLNVPRGTFVSVPYATQEAYEETLLNTKDLNIMEQPGKLELFVDKNPVTINEGERTIVTLEVNPVYAQVEHCIWTSSNEEVARMSGTGIYGEVWAINPGECEVTATVNFRAETFTTTFKVIVAGESGLELPSFEEEQWVEVHTLDGLKIYEGYYGQMNLAPGIYLITADGNTLKVRISK